MCEVAIIDPQEYSPVEIADIAERLYNRMPDSLGIVSVRDLGDRFIYDTYKAVDPIWSEVTEFAAREQDVGSIRFVIHARLATHGAETVQNAHPLRVNCSECDIDYVVHNGVLRRYRMDRNEHRTEGHEYKTNVDSENIAHEYESIPKDFDDGLYVEYSTQPAFILFAEDGAFIHSSAHYVLAETGEMARDTRYFQPKADTNYQQVILTPGGSQ